MEQLDELLQKHKAVLSGYHSNRLNTITKVKEQQWQLHFGKQSTVPNRIVSLHKPYLFNHDVSFPLATGYALLPFG